LQIDALPESMRALTVLRSIRLQSTYGVVLGRHCVSEIGVHWMGGGRGNRSHVCSVCDGVNR
jgi:hypothetical protein